MSGRWTRRVVSNKTCQEDDKEEQWVIKHVRKMKKKTTEWIKHVRRWKRRELNE